MSTPFTEIYPLVRATLGDFRTNKLYSDAAIRDVIFTVVKTGKLPGYAVGPDNVSITPDLAKPADWGIVMLQASIRLLLPRVRSYAFDTRELKERFGEQLPFLITLMEWLFEAENPDMFGTQQDFVAWVNGQTGLDVYGQLTEVNIQAPIETLTIGANGISSSG